MIPDLVPATMATHPAAIAGPGWAGPLVEFAVVSFGFSGMLVALAVLARRIETDPRFHHDHDPNSHRILRALRWSRRGCYTAAALLGLLAVALTIVTTQLTQS